MIDFLNNTAFSLCESHVITRLQILFALGFLIEQAFREQGIVIAFPQRDVHVNFTDPGQLAGLSGNSYE